LTTEVLATVQLWGGGASGSESHCEAPDDKNGGAAGYLSFDLTINPRVYGRYVFHIGGPGEDSFVTWSSFKIPDQREGPLPNTASMPRGPFTCEQLADAGSCSMADGQCCTSCASEDLRCADDPVELARAGTGTTGQVQTRWYHDTSHCINCGSGSGLDGSSTPSTGGDASVNILVSNNMTTTTPGESSGAATSAGGFSAGAGGTHASSSNQAFSCIVDCQPSPGTPGLVVIRFKQ